MTSHRTLRLATVSTLFFSTFALAEDYDYEIGISFAQLESDSVTVSTLGTPSGPITARSDSSSDVDIFDVSGSWFYSGLSDAEGPKTRAAFIDRASSLSLSYAATDQSNTIDFSVTGLPDTRSTSSVDSRAYAVDLRHVWKESGWYALASLGRATIDSDFGNVFNSSSSSRDTNIIALGVGKYLADTTAIDVRLVSQDTDSSRASGASLNLRHLGSIGETWMFGADASLTKTDTSGNGDAYSLRLSLYPNSDIDFGVAYFRRDLDFGVDAESFDLFAGWFFSDNMSVRASYTEDTTDTGLASDVDSDGFEIGFVARF